MRLAATLFFAVLLAPAFVSAEELQLVTGNEYEPYTDQKLPEGGLATEIVRAAFAKEGHTVKVEFAPWKRGAELAAKGEVAATFPYVISEERQKTYNYSEPMLFLQQILKANPASGITSADPASLKGKRICLPLGYSTVKTVQPLVDSKEIIRSELPDMKSCMQHVASGRSDFLIIDKISGAIAMSAAQQTEASFKSFPVENATNTLHLIVGKERADGAKVLAAFNAGFAKLKSGGELAAIIKKHVPGYTE
ncbi:substrate-binding periplasmic protein [Lacibacterium aquatile]|uniref:Substrate-binding periplasmic protein n=1 Tax=Lacibacterium aquatile TaxID=1168082 RepID=A0ABW5DKS4_9PROT